ncbi:class I SAM-dependent methyltransferase [Salinibacterium soli]|uniref:Class I SAM-dependent methyltransferase n=1 Tax=Antiquaquibacter soli TaxID=3064523 RepID=A0ABT9BND8_9MICO|nr:class I SAM-dependent methyltransferase [Protaetiibacter sp. WY-16]MDO7882556.1 class I SAM-dependent methyltransferase [Protaetiibacter sp. WY-16]
MADRQGDDAAYSRWKGWGSTHRFGQFTAGDADYYRRELRTATAIGRPVADVLEVGFGDGAFLGYGRSQGWRMTGTELSSVQVAAGLEAGFDVHPSTALDSFAESSFDLIVLFDVLEHLEQDTIVDFLSQLRSLLRPDGRMLLRYPNVDTWLGNALQYGDPTHVTQIGYYKMTYFAEAAGLEVLRYRGPVRRGFRTSIVHGLHRLTAGPLIAVSAAFVKALYYPGTPIVLTSVNSVCTVGVRRDA